MTGSVFISRAALAAVGATGSVLLMDAMLSDDSHDRLQKRVQHRITKMRTFSRGETGWYKWFGSP